MRLPLGQRDGPATVAAVVAAAATAAPRAVLAAAPAPALVAAAGVLCGLPGRQR